MSRSQPIVISIGPALCGKTTYLNSLQKSTGAKVEVVAIDDQDGVYINIPMSHARRIITGSMSIICRERFQDRRSYGMLHSERALDVQGEETRLILKLLTRDQRYGDAIKSRLKSIWMENATKSSKATPREEVEKQKRLCGWVPHLLDMIGRELEGGLSMQSRCYMMFCGPAIRYAVAQCKKSLLELSRKEPHKIICFGNTNTSVEHYGYALDVAAKTKRPVQFVRYKSELGDTNLLELYKRNLQRFAKTGKYIPLHAIMKHITETEAILVEEGNLRTPKDLCELAGFVMHEDFSVTPKTKPAFNKRISPFLY